MYGVTPIAPTLVVVIPAVHPGIDVSDIIKEKTFEARESGSRMTDCGRQSPLVRTSLAKFSAHPGSPWLQSCVYATHRGKASDGTTA